MHCVLRVPYCYILRDSQLFFTFQTNLQCIRLVYLYPADCSTKMFKRENPLRVIYRLRTHVPQTNFPPDIASSSINER